MFYIICITLKGFGQVGGEFGSCVCNGMYVCSWNRRVDADMLVMYGCFRYIYIKFSLIFIVSCLLHYVKFLFFVHLWPKLVRIDPECLGINWFIFTYVFELFGLVSFGSRLVLYTGFKIWQ